MIGSIGPGLPHAVLMASGRHAGPLRFDADRPTPRADVWLENKFAPWTRSILQDWAEGALDELECVVFSRAEDNAQRLYYYVCELQRQGKLRGPEPLIFDAAMALRSSSEDHMIREVRRLAAHLGVQDDALERGVAAVNAAVAAVRRPASGACLLIGTPPPDRRLHDAIATAGFSAAGQTLPDLWADPGEPVEAGTGDPAGAIGRALHRATGFCRAFADPALRLEQDIAEFRPAAAILWCSEDDEAFVWRVPALTRAMRDAALPHLVLTRRAWDARDGAAEEIVRFLEGLAR